MLHFYSVMGANPDQLYYRSVFCFNVQIVLFSNGKEGLTQRSVIKV